jgi:hypothetical protein
MINNNIISKNLFDVLKKRCIHYRNGPKIRIILFLIIINIYAEQLIINSLVYFVDPQPSSIIDDDILAAPITTPISSSNNRCTFFCSFQSISLGSRSGRKVKLAVVVKLFLL